MERTPLQAAFDTVTACERALRSAPTEEQLLRLAADLSAARDVLGQVVETEVSKRKALAAVNASRRVPEDQAQLERARARELWQKFQATHRGRGSKASKASAIRWIAKSEGLPEGRVRGYLNEKA